LQRSCLAVEPRIFRIENFISADEAVNLRALLDAQPGRDTETGHVSELPEHPGLEDIKARIEREVGLESHVRSLRYRRYAEGDGHPPHLDDYEIDGALLVATAMLCVGEPEAGGGTEFPHAAPYALRVEATCGALLHWRNVRTDGQPEPRSSHRGVPVLRGTKAVLLVFVYAPLEVFRAHEAEHAAAYASRLREATFTPPAPGTQLTTIVDRSLPRETTSLLRDACDARGIVYREIEARFFDYSGAQRLPPGAMLFRPAVSRAAQHVEEFLVASNVATFHGECEGTFFPCAAPEQVRQRAGIEGPRCFPVASTEQTLLDSFVERLGGFPVVLKVPGGEGGLGVMRVDGMVTLVSLVDYLVRAQGHVPLLSAYIPDAVHHRVIVVGDQAVASYENPIRDGDFRSIPSLEPEAYSGTVAPALGQIAVAATRAERLAFAGVDLIVHPTGRVYVLEVNYPCYFAQATLGGGIDVAGRMVDYLVARALQLVGSPA
jgi:hypothetical protein